MQASISYLSQRDQGLLKEVCYQGLFVPLHLSLSRHIITVVVHIITELQSWGLSMMKAQRDKVTEQGYTASEGHGSDQNLDLLIVNTALFTDE